MGNVFKEGDSITLYFGDTMRNLLPKVFRKRKVYFIDFYIAKIEDGLLSVISQARNIEDEPPYKILALNVKADDKHILPAGTLEILRGVKGKYLDDFADARSYNAKEFREALRPYCNSIKKN